MYARFQVVSVCPVVGPVVERRRSYAGPLTVSYSVPLASSYAGSLAYRDWKRVEALEKDLYSWKSRFASVNSRFAELR